MLSLLPILVATDIFLTVHLVTQGDLSLEVLEIHRLEYDRDDVHYVQEFLLYLIGAAEDMSIILRKATYTGQSVQLSTLLIPANRTELSETQRQVLIRTRRVFIDHTVMRTVHRFQEVFLTLLRCMDRLERILSVFSVVAGGNIQ